MTKRTNYVTNCGDWHLGWGFGGSDKIGKLRMTAPPDDNGFAEFEWKGRSQGRHGGGWNFGAFLRFKSDGNSLKSGKSNGSSPVHSELLKSARELLEKYADNNK